MVEVRLEYNMMNREVRVQERLMISNCGGMDGVKSSLNDRGISLEEARGKLN